MRTTAAARVPSRAPPGKPLGVVRRGVGNGTPDRAEGWVTDRVHRDLPARSGAGPEPGAGRPAAALGAAGSARARRSGRGGCAALGADARARGLTSDVDDEGERARR